MKDEQNPRSLLTSADFVDVSHTRMNCDESTAESKLTDVTHCDLETKSILKPRKVRAPLQEVDLGNQITVEFDVIRKRRVSFAGVNRIKEFDSEAKSFCIFNTPAYEEKVSTSSDSSALSSSVSGNIQILTKENDITIFLEDTMDLTDLSIVQPSCATDMTTPKPQGCLPDIFAPKSQDTDTILLGYQISDKRSDHPVFHSENDNLNLNPDPIQAFNKHKMEKPANSPPVIDPTKMLIKELLEDSMVDFCVDKSSKASSLFMQNKFPLVPNTNTHDLGESKCLSTNSRKTPEMDFAEALPNPISEVVFPTNAYKYSQMPAKFNPYQTHHKIISQNLPNLFGAQQVDIKEPSSTKLFQSNASQMDFTEDVPKPFSNAIFPLNSIESEIPQELVDSSQPSQRIMPQNPFNVFGSHQAVKEELKLIKGFQSNISQMEFTEAIPPRKAEAFQNPVIRSQNTETGLLETLRTPKIKFAEAIPSKNTHMIQQHIIVGKLNSEIELSTNVHNMSLMEFTEALPSRNIQGATGIMEKKNVSFGKNNFMCNEKSEYHTHRTSNMEFTEGLPLQKICADSEDLPAHIHASSIPVTDILGNGNDKSINPGSQIFLKESNKILMELLDSPKSNSHLNRENVSHNPEDLNDSNLMDVTELDYNQADILKKENFLKQSKNKLLSRSHFENDELLFKYKDNASQMEFTDALSPKDKLNDSCTMDVTENDVKLNYFTRKENVCNEKNGNVEGTCTMTCGDFLESEIQTKQDLHPRYNELIKANVISTTQNNNSTMKLCEDSPSENNHTLGSNLMKEKPFVSKNANVIKRNSIIAHSRNHTVDTSHMEFTEALPQWKPQSNQLANSKEFDKDIKENMCSDRNVHITKRKSIMAPSGNYTVDTSHMEFTEALPQWKPQSNQLANSKEMKENICSDRNVHITERKSIMAPSGNYTVDTSHMEFTEALPQWRPQSNQLANSKEMKENICGDRNVHITERKSIMAPGGNYTVDTSHMEFTEALPQWKPQSNQLANSKEMKENICSDRNVHITERKSIMAPSGNYTVDTSHMEFTEALPQWKPQSNQLANSKEMKENICSDRNVHVTERKSIMAPSGNYTVDTSHMEFTEALPQWKPQSNQLANSKEMKENICSDRNVHITERKSIMAPSGNYTVDTSHMEFTEALPQWKPQSNQLANSKEMKENICSDRNVHITERKSIMAPSGNYTVDTSHMEFTEALPQWKPQSNQLANSKEMKENICSDRNVHATERKSIMALSGNYTVDTSHMEFTEALPQWKHQSNQLANSKEMKENICSDRNVHVTERKSIMAPSGNYTVDTSHMEFTEALPQWKPQSNQLANSKEMKENICSDRNVHIIERKSIMAPSGNYTIDTSHMEFTEALPQWRPQSNQLANSQQFEKEVKENLCGDGNVHATERKSIMAPSGNYTVDTSHMEFTEALPQWMPQSNQLANSKEFDKDIKENMCSDRNVHITKRKSITAPSGNYTVDTSHMEFTEALPQWKPQSNVSESSQVDTVSRNISVSDNYSQPKIENSLLMDVTEIGPVELNPLIDAESNVGIVTNCKQSEGTLSCRQLMDQSSMQFTESVCQQEPISEQVNSSDFFTNNIDNTPIDFIGDMQHRKSNVYSARSEGKFIKISQMELPDAIPIEKLVSKPNANFSENSPELSRNISEEELNDENIPQVYNQKMASPHSSIQLNFTDAVQFQPKINLEQNAAVGSQNNNCKSGTQLVDNNSDKNVNETYEMEFTEVEDADQVQVGPTGRINDHSISSTEIIVNKSNSLSNIIENISPEKVALGNNQELKNMLVIWGPESDNTATVEPSRSLLQEIDTSNLSNKAPSKTEMDFPVQSPLMCPYEINQISPGISFSKKADNNQGFTLAPVNKGHEAASEIIHVSLNSHTNCLFSEDGSTIDVDQSDSPTPDDNINNELRKNSEIFGTIKSNNGPQSHSECNTTEIPCIITDTSVAVDNLPKMEQELPRTCLLQEYNPGLKVSNDNCERVEIVDNINDVSLQKKNLVHFNTPPVRSIIKKRKTLGPDQSLQLTQSICSNLSQCFNYESEINSVLSKPQKKGLFDEERKSLFDSDKGKEEWERLLKNDSFMKANEFEFVSTTRWKYKFKWPVELSLEIPQAEVDQSSRKKSIALISKISQCDQLSMFVDTRMKKNLGVIFSEKWLNSHCKTIKDLLVTIKFVEQEYSKLEPLISSLRYFYQEFPFDFNNDRVIFTIVNLRKKYCFEVRIDVSYGLVKGKNIDVINRVGHISKTKVQQCFDQLLPNTERFFLFWQKLKRVDML